MLLGDSDGRVSLASSVHHVTAAEALECAYSAHDVVLPLPGTDTHFPTDGEVGALYRRLLYYDGVDSDAVVIEVASGAGELALRGSYRKLLICPTRFTWRLFEREQGEAAAKAPSKRLAAAEATLEHPAAALTDSTARRWDVKLRFDLPPGVYATEALREVSRPHPPPSKVMHARWASDDEA